MDQDRVHAVARFVSGLVSRRTVLRGLAGAAAGRGLARFAEDGAARGSRGPRSKKELCLRNGSPCKKPGRRCKPKYCLNAPFTIEAKWTKTADHEAYLFVPPQNATTGPGAHIYAFCNPSNSFCEEQYPYACVDKDEFGIGAEVTTVYRLLPEAYEYWVELKGVMPVGDVAVVLKDGDGRVARRWQSPAKSSTNEAGWHVFDFDGRDKRIASIDALLEAKTGLPDDAYDPHTLVCPYKP